MSMRFVRLIVACVLFAGFVSLARAEDLAPPNDGPSLVLDSPSDVFPWEVKAGAVFLQRGGLPAQELARGLSDLPNQTLNADQFNFGVQGGPDLTIVRHGDAADIEFRWFQVQNAMAQTPTASDSSGGTASGFGLYFRYVLGMGGGPSTLSAQYASDLSSFELNFKRPVNDWVTAFAGLRVVEFDEVLSFNGVANGTVLNPLYVRSFNDLYGFQLGSDVTLWNRGGPFRLVATGKVGVYADSASNRADDAGITAGFVDSAVTCYTSFLGEIDLAATYQITEHLAARLGYQLMWLDGVALASQQQPRLDPAHDPGDFGVASVAMHGTAFYQGAMVGLDYRF